MQRPCAKLCMSSRVSRPLRAPSCALSAFHSPLSMYGAFVLRCILSTSLSDVVVEGRASSAPPPAHITDRRLSAGLLRGRVYRSQLYLLPRPRHGRVGRRGATDGPLHSRGHEDMNLASMRACCARLCALRPAHPQLSPPAVNLASPTMHAVHGHETDTALGTTTLRLRRSSCTVTPAIHLPRCHLRICARVAQRLLRPPERVVCHWSRHVSELRHGLLA